MGLFTYMRKPWLRRNYKSVTFKMSVSYILHHLGKYDLDKVYRPNDWQDAKEKKVLSWLDAGKNPFSIPPIRIVLHAQREEFRVEDGISRLRAFRKKGISSIYANVRVGEW